MKQTIAESGIIMITGDENITQKVAGQDLTGVSIASFRQDVGANSLAHLYEKAISRGTDHDARIYVKAKTAYVRAAYLTRITDLFRRFYELRTDLERGVFNKAHRMPSERMRPLFEHLRGESEWTDIAELMLTFLDKVKTLTDEYHGAVVQDTLCGEITTIIEQVSVLKR